jgi:predicted anti-sigma-YlaC factor YlaD
MDCTLILADLIAYHFATADDVERERVEGHLLECKSCLRFYLAMKADADRAKKAPELPSEASRLKLRNAVANRFRPTAGTRFQRWLARPVPRYQGLAVASLLAMGVALAPALTRHLPSKSPDTTRLDTSRTTAESRFIY